LQRKTHYNYRSTRT